MSMVAPTTRVSRDMLAPQERATLFQLPPPPPYFPTHTLTITFSPYRVSQPTHSLSDQLSPYYPLPVSERPCTHSPQPNTHATLHTRQRWIHVGGLTRWRLVLGFVCLCIGMHTYVACGSVLCMRFGFVVWENSNILSSNYYQQSVSGTASIILSYLISTTTIPTYSWGGGAKLGSS